MEITYNKAVPVKYILSGMLRAQGFIHAKRTIDIHVLIVVRKGTLNIEIDGRRLKIRRGEYVILPAGVCHKGFEDADTAGELEYFWAHFIFAGDYTITEGSGLPIAAALSSFARVNILISQLLDISLLPDADIDYCGFLLSALLCEIRAETSGAEVGGSKLMNNILSWINLHIYEDITLSSVADAFGYDKKYLARIFKAGTGSTVGDVITKKKLDIAKQYLVGSDEHITDIAARLGYTDAGYFMRLFKKHEGVTCTAYRSAYSKMYVNKE